MRAVAPQLQPYTIELCFAILILITIFNLRGLREAGLAFVAPTYVFAGSLLITIAVGLVRSVLAGGHPRPIVPPPALPAATAGITLWLLLRAFGSGCTALTGVEAVSNGVQAFREPVTRNAQRTLGMIVTVLAVMLGGIAYLVRAFHVAATPPGQPGYQSLLSILTAAVAGRGIYYGISRAAILAVLCLSANTSFADFPRVCHILAEDGFLPHFFGNTGRRLVYTPGILVLFGFAGALLWLFGGITDRLISLFAIGAFTAFTLSQAGMVQHWRRQGRQHWQHQWINGIGAVATGITVLIVLTTKFIEGAWITVLLIPFLVIFMFAVRRHYARAAHLIAADRPVDLNNLQPPLVIVPLQTWNRISARANRVAFSLLHEIQVIHIIGEGTGGDAPHPFRDAWERNVVAPARAAGLPEPKLELIPSPYRLVIGPIRDYILDVANQHRDRQITVVIPELVTMRWYRILLHNQLATGLKAILLVEGNERISVVNVPWYLRA